MTNGDISTHILTKRMTSIGTMLWGANLYFNSHPHEEDDLSTTPNIFLYLYFNSHPHEEDDSPHPGGHL